MQNYPQGTLDQGQIGQILTQHVSAATETPANLIHVLVLSLPNYILGICIQYTHSGGFIPSWAFTCCFLTWCPTIRFPSACFPTQLAMRLVLLKWKSASPSTYSQWIANVLSSEDERSVPDISDLSFGDFVMMKWTQDFSKESRGALAIRNPLLHSREMTRDLTQWCTEEAASSSKGWRNCKKWVTTHFPATLMNGMLNSHFLLCSGLEGLTGVLFLQVKHFNKMVLEG